MTPVAKSLFEASLRRFAKRKSDPEDIPKDLSQTLSLVYGNVGAGAQQAAQPQATPTDSPPRYVSTQVPIAEANYNITVLPPQSIVRFHSKFQSDGDIVASMKKLCELTVNFGPSKEVAFASRLAGFSMHKRASKKTGTHTRRTLYDTIYRASSMKIWRYIFTSDGGEIVLHEEVDGTVGWQWTSEIETKEQWRRFRAHMEHIKIDQYLDATLVCGPGKSLFGDVRAKTILMEDLPEKLARACENQSAMQPDGGGQTRFYDIPKLYALGGDGTFFCLWYNGSYCYALDPACGLLQEIRKGAAHVRSFLTVSLSPFDTTQFFVLADTGFYAAYAVAHELVPDMEKSVNEHWKKWQESELGVPGDEAESYVNEKIAQ